MKQKNLVNAFSPSMLSGSCSLEYRECSRENWIKEVAEEKPSSAISHEITAHLLSQITGSPVQANRTNLTVNPEDVLYGFTPGFRCSEAREFTYEEINNAPHKFWIIKIHEEGK